MAVSAAVVSPQAYVPAVKHTGLSAAAVASVGVPTKPEFDAVVALVNDLRQIILNLNIA